MPFKTPQDRHQFKEQLTPKISNFSSFIDADWFEIGRISNYLAWTMLADGVPLNPALSAQNIFNIFLDTHQLLRGGPIPDPFFSVRKIRRTDITEELELIYPDHEAVFIHKSIIIPCSGLWILRVGEIIVPAVSPSKDEFSKDENKHSGIPYGMWARNLPLTKKLIESFFREIFTRIKEEEEKNIKSKGYGATELILEQFGGASANTLISRGKAVVTSISQAKNAFNQNFFIETTVLCECIISRIINEALAGSGYKAESTLMGAMEKLKESFESIENDKDMVEKMHSWRKKRNHVVHHFITSQIDNGPEALDKLNKNNKKIAEEGIELAEWFLYWRIDWAINQIKFRV
jgi:hypothetical protein